jgi:hypothetical protein
LLQLPARGSSSSSSSLTYFLTDLLRRPIPRDSTLRPFSFIFIFTEESASDGTSSSGTSPTEKQLPNYKYSQLPITWVWISQSSR